MKKIEYKDTKLGKIPIDWDIKKLRDVSDIIDCKHITFPYVEKGIPIISPGTIREGDVDLSICPKVSLKHYKILSENRKPEKGDIVYGRNASIGIGSYVNTNDNFAIGQNTVLIKPKKINNLFLYYNINSPIPRRLIKRMEQGSTYMMIKMGTIRNLLIPVPLENEQKIIVKILKNVDNLIQTTYDIIENLQECKNGLMQILFTRGIKHNEYKETKIGSIPVSWKIFKLGSILDSVNINVKNLKKKNKEIPILSMTRYEGLIFQKDKFSRRVASENIENYKIIKKNQICCGFPMDEGVIYSLKVCDVGAVSPAYSIWEIKSEEVDNNYLDYVLRIPRMIRTYINYYNHTVGRRRIVSNKDFKNIQIQIPPIQEQKFIVKILDDCTKRIENEENYIKKLKKIKKGLMQVLFTGKKRVLA